MPATLTTEQLTVARSWLGDGTDPTDEYLNERWDALGSLKSVVLETLRKRHATLVNDPAQFAIPQEYSQSTAANITALERLIAEVESQPSDLGVGTVNAYAPQRVVRPDTR